MNVLIVEDEAPAARRLRRLVAAELAVDPAEILMADSLLAARQCLSRTHVDLLLLDLDLAGHDGFEALRSVRGPMPATVVVSANVDRALEAFDRDVIDFVSKPVAAKRLARALCRARDGRREDARLAIRSLGRMEIVDVDDILHIAGADDYVEITTQDGRRLLHSERLDTLERRLPNRFIRTHRSHIVNLAQVVQLQFEDQDRRLLVTRDGTRIPVSRRRIRAVREALLKVPSDDRPEI